MLCDSTELEAAIIFHERFIACKNGSFIAVDLWVEYIVNKVKALCDASTDANFSEALLEQSATLVFLLKDITDHMYEEVEAANNPSAHQQTTRQKNNMVYANRIYSAGSGHPFKLEQPTIPPFGPDVFELGMKKIQKGKYLDRLLNRLCFPRPRTGQRTNFGACRHPHDDEDDDDDDNDDDDFGFPQADRRDDYSLFDED